MGEPIPSFTFEYLDYRLRERLEEALAQVNALSQEDVLQCDEECLKQFVLQFSIKPPVLRLDQRVIDDETFELVDDSFDRKNLRLSPDDEDGSLARDASYRMRLVDRYVRRVVGSSLTFDNIK